MEELFRRRILKWYWVSGLAEMPGSRASSFGGADEEYLSTPLICRLRPGFNFRDLQGPYFSTIRASNDKLRLLYLYLTFSFYEKKRRYGFGGVCVGDCSEMAEMSLNASHMVCEPTRFPQQERQPPADVLTGCFCQAS